MFHDGRVTVDPSQPSGFQSPAGNDLPLGLDNSLAVQAMFPVTSMTEMAGQPGENPVAVAASAGILAGPGGVWDQLATRLKAQPAYVTAFIDVYSDVNTAADITFVHAANAIAAYETVAFRADRSPFDRYLRGDKHAMSKEAQEGMKLFYGKAGCASCHSGPFQTDHDFHAIAMPQIGPGKGDGSGHEDFGRGRETGLGSDMFKFRTPTLRNVALTGPWGHAGAYDSLEAVVRHHLDPVQSCQNYDPTQAVLPSRTDLDAIDLLVLNDPAAMSAITGACELAPQSLNNKKVGYLLAFLHALTDPRSLDLRNTAPRSVLSGLPLAE
jgi:cytochrome c peroxidase